MKNVAIVSGAAGLIGSEAVKHFSGLGMHTVGIDNGMRSYFFGEEASTAWVRDRLKSEKIVTEMGGQFANDLDIPVEKKVKTTELLKDIDSHFGGKPAEVVSEK